MTKWEDGTNISKEYSSVFGDGVYISNTIGRDFKENSMI
jgi:hypothetical protein